VVEKWSIGVMEYWSDGVLDLLGLAVDYVAFLYD